MGRSSEHWYTEQWTVNRQWSVHMIIIIIVIKRRIVNMHSTLDNFRFILFSSSPPSSSSSFSSFTHLQKYKMQNNIAMCIIIMIIIIVISVECRLWVLTTTTIVVTNTPKTLELVHLILCRYCRIMSCSLSFDCNATVHLHEYAPFRHISISTRVVVMSCTLQIIGHFDDTNLGHRSHLSTSFK